jgi:hypothetical protein
VNNEPAGEELSTGDDLIECEGHGPQPTALACVHLVEADHGETDIGFNWSNDEGELVANCDACELECDEDGFFPDELVEETFVVICKSCFEEMARAHGVEVNPPTQ